MDEGYILRTFVELALVELNEPVSNRDGAEGGQ